MAGEKSLVVPDREIILWARKGKSMTTYTNLSVPTLSRLIEGAVTVVSHDVLNGIQWRVMYPNGYGFSAVKHDGSYGRESDLWELAVLRKDEGGCRLVYDTPITNDVLGWLSEDDLLAAAEEIRSLQ